MKLPSRKFSNELMNKGHRYLVNSSIAFTLISTGLLGVLMVDRFLNSESAESQIDPIKQSSESLGTKNAQKNIANKSIDSARKIFDSLGMPVSTKHKQPDHGVNTVFIDCANTKIELIDPIDECKSPILNFLTKNKNGGLHHICFEVDNLDMAISMLRAKGVQLLSEKPRIGAHGKPVIFCHPKDCSGVLIELEQV
ncbi:transcription initiation protein SPT3 [Sarcoptes scabiei]|nr:transcription initiation protein SPT3 [Sarcoptes scabiei]